MSEHKAGKPKKQPAADVASKPDDETKAKQPPPAVEGKKDARVRDGSKLLQTTSSLPAVPQQCSLSASRKVDQIDQAAHQLLVAGPARGDDSSAAPLDLFHGQAAEPSSNIGQFQGDGWSIQAGKRRRTHVDSGHATCCFIGGLSVDVTEKYLLSNVSAHGVNIYKCHILPSQSSWPDSRAMKVFISDESVGRALSKEFWPDGVWCRKWQGQAKTSVESS